MAKILGLDLGTASIGWAVIETNDNKAPINILGIGSRVVPVDTKIINLFSKGKDCSLNADRTTSRMMRRMNQRFKLRRDFLLKEFEALGVDLSEINKPKSATEKWKLRAMAASQQITLAELAEVLLHINSRRGYKASKEDLNNSGKKMGEHLNGIKNLYLDICSLGLTPGEYFYSKLIEDPNFRIKGKVLPRQAYQDEVDKILACQAAFYPSILTRDVIDKLTDYIIFYQRPLRSCKHLVSNCELEKLTITTDGKEKEIGPKVAHISNPLFQASRIWQLLNNISFSNREEKLLPTLEQKQELAKQLLFGDDLKVKGIKQLCGLKPTDTKWRISENAAKGIKASATMQILSKILKNKYRNLLRFNLQIEDIVDKTTGEVKGCQISPAVFDEPLYRLWHAIYSIDSIDNLGKTLRDQFGIDDDEVIDSLCAIDFSKQGYGKLSAKALRRILPYLMQGQVYSEACASAGYNHSGSITRQENQERTLLESLPLITKGAMRQPVVEKILNQMINLVNSLMKKYGAFDSIHVEMARELKMGKDERDSMTTGIAKNEKKNDEMRDRIKGYGLYPTMSRITKMKLWEESEHMCIYCNTKITITQFLNGIDSEIEHIIPKSLLFDDSFANKVCSCRKCNHEKGQMTAIDFMRTKPQAQLDAYLERISAMRDDKKISGTKYKHLMMSKDEIPTDFIERDLRETQYIAKAALALLHQVCRDVMATSGKVTDYIRRQWGWDTLLHEVDLPLYREAGLTEIIKKDGDSQPTERIKDWSKRLDHRHHALDALVIASTDRSTVNQLNHLNTLPNCSSDDDKMGKKDEKRSRLEKYILSLPHFSRETVADALRSTAVSVKPRTKLTTPGKVIKHAGQGAKCVQTGIIVPRGPLHEGTVYGIIKRYNEKTKQLEDKAVARYKLTSIKNIKDAEDNIVDKHISRLVVERIKEFGGDAVKALSIPLYSDKAGKQQIKYVRCLTGGTKLIPVRKDKAGQPIGFAAPGSNHHVALYVDAGVNIQECVASFAHCVQRKLYGIPAIIKDPSDTWSVILSAPDKYDPDFLNQLPNDGLRYLMHMQINEMFILGLDDATFTKAIEGQDKQLLTEHLYRVQSLSSKAYLFTLHTVTASKPDSFKPKDMRFRLVKSIGRLKDLNPHKVIVTSLGEIKPT